MTKPEPQIDTSNTATQSVPPCPHGPGCTFAKLPIGCPWSTVPPTSAQLAAAGGVRGVVDRERVEQIRAFVAMTATEDRGYEDELLAYIDQALPFADTTSAMELAEAIRWHARVVGLHPTDEPVDYLTSLAMVIGVVLQRGRVSGDRYIAVERHAEGADKIIGDRPISYFVDESWARQYAKLCNAGGKFTADVEVLGPNPWVVVDTRPEENVRVKINAAERCPRCDELNCPWPAARAAVEGIPGFGQKCSPADDEKWMALGVAASACNELTLSQWRTIALEARAALAAVGRMPLDRDRGAPGRLTIVVEPNSGYVLCEDGLVIATAPSRLACERLMRALQLRPQILHDGLRRALRECDTASSYGKVDRIAKILRDTLGQP